MTAVAPQGLSFLKMHGLGNDFVVLDGRARPLVLGPAQVRRIADRHTGVGCDQLIIVEPSRNRQADAFMTIRNADGSEVATCGNATRCVAWMLMRESGQDEVIIETKAGLLDAHAAADGQIAVDMGRALLDWREIPLAEAVDTNHLPIVVADVADPVGVGMGNPHAVFFIPDAEAVDVAELGPQIEHHPLFPERTNVEFASILPGNRIRMRVWERGTGITRACGSGACATLVAAARRGLTGRGAEILLDGGSLHIEWLRDDHVLMTGPAVLAYTGTLDPSLSP
jgi:diaminopimelate epimerase